MAEQKSLSVLFLTRYPQEGASSRYRVFQYVPYLEELGIDCTVQSFMDTEMYRLSLSSGDTFKKIVMTLRATLRRLRILSGFRQFDVIYMQREIFPFGPPLVERLLKKMGVPLVFDYDDALFIKKPSRYNPIATFFRSPEKTRVLLGLVDRTIAGNNWLRENAESEGGKAVTIEVAEDTARFVSANTKFAQRSGPVTVGWLGSPSTAKYMSEIEEELREIAARNPEVRWEMMGSGKFAMAGVPWVTEEWSIEAEKAALARYDIGLMPLPKQEWSRGKSGGKARTYMAAAVVPVVESIGYNRELIRHGETGFLCETGGDWIANLESMIRNFGARENVARAAQNDVEMRFSPSKKAAEIAAVLREIAGVS